MKSKLVLLVLLGSLTIISCKKKGCTNPVATNYDSEAKKNDGTCTYADTGGVRIWTVIAYPDADEQVTIKNTSDSTYEVEGWTIGDTDDPYAFTIPPGTTLFSNSSKTWNASVMGFLINDSNEIIYLRDDQGDLVDTWEN